MPVAHSYDLWNVSGEIYVAASGWGFRGTVPFSVPGLLDWLFRKFNLANLFKDGLTKEQGDGCILALDGRSSCWTQGWSEQSQAKQSECLFFCTEQSWVWSVFESCGNRSKVLILSDRWVFHLYMSCGWSLRNYILWSLNNKRKR